MNYPALGRIENSKRKRNSILSNMSGSKLCHRMKLRFAGLAKPIGIDHESMLAIEAAAHRLEQQHLKRVKQLAVLRKSKVRIVAAEIQ